MQSPATSSTSPLCIRPSQPSDRAALYALVTQAGVFVEDEVSVAMELIDVALQSPERDPHNYMLLVTELMNSDGTGSGQLVGYICYGRVPMTQGAWDLYWLATDPSFRRQGIAANLCKAMEAEIKDLGGTVIRVETSSTDGYGAAQSFYERNGYPERCRIPNFYKPGDDLITMFKLV